MSSPKRNYIYNVLYQILSMAIPVIMAPYLARTIGADGIGIYSYTHSIVSYFMMLTLLGISNYGNRSIARMRDDKEKMSKHFWEIYSIQLIAGCFMLLLYMLMVATNEENRIICLCQLPFILSSMIDISWFFFGLEEFKKTITRNSIIKIINVALIFIFVNSGSDVWKYTLIMSSMTLLSQIILWGFARKKLKLVRVYIKDIKKHIKPILLLFIPVVAVSLYKIMDKIMLGSLSSVTEVGYYESAEKIVNIPLAIITALGTVMLPRMSNIIAKGDGEKIKNIISKSMLFVTFMSSAMAAGLIVIGKNFAVLFYGDGFEKSGILIMLLAVTMPIISFANILRMQYLIPKEKDKIYVKSVILGAIINLTMNSLMIPCMQSVGACIGTIMAEAAVMIYQAFAIRNELPIKKYVLNSIPFCAKAMAMLLMIYPISYVINNKILAICAQVGVGSLMYILLNSKYIIAALPKRTKRKT